MTGKEIAKELKKLPVDELKTIIEMFGAKRPIVPFARAKRAITD